METETIKNAASHTRLPDQYAAYQARVIKKLDILLKKQWLPIDPRTDQLHDAMRYVIESGGKRLRPILVYATGAALSLPIHHLDAAACAIELMHTYSLVHDDLPAMDDDDFRRDRPTCHKAFQESTAILVGDSLQTMAFELLSDPELNPISPEQQLAQIQALSKASGPHGMIGGQMLDLMAEGDRSIDEKTLETMYRCKTGALIRVSIELAFLASLPLAPSLKASLLNFAEIIGLAFQIKDDLLDLVETKDAFGNPVISSDIQKNKMTFPLLLGLEKTQEKLSQLIDSAEKILEPLGKLRDELMPIAQFCVARRI
jgi:geranylgeranyl pyrophosphate synthase